MSAQPKYVMQPDFDAALIAISGHIDHSALLSKAEIRREITESENRLTAKIETTKTELQVEIQATEDRLRGEIQASEARLQAQIETLTTQMETLTNRMEKMETRLDRVENMGKVNHQMLQLILDQLSTINKKLGTN